MTPHEYAYKKIEVTGLYSRDSEKLEEILVQKPALWLELRKTCSSDAKTDKEWERTEKGIEEMVLKFRLKRYEKELSSISSMLRVLEQEAKNII